MKKRVFIIHGWGHRPQMDWFEWLQAELEKKGFEVFLPEMPNTDEPKINEWVPYLASLIDEPDENTFFVGHSVGCQTIMRYLETIDTKVGGVVFVAGWVILTGLEDEEWPIARPWLDTQIDFAKVKNNANKIVAIFSDNDEYVPMENVEIFKKEFGIEPIIMHDAGHINERAKFKELPEALDAVFKISQ